MDNIHSNVIHAVLLLVDGLFNFCALHYPVFGSRLSGSRHARRRSLLDHSAVLTARTFHRSVPVLRGNEVGSLRLCQRPEFIMDVVEPPQNE